MAADGQPGPSTKITLVDSGLWETGQDQHPAIASSSSMRLFPSCIKASGARLDDYVTTRSLFETEQCTAYTASISDTPSLDIQIATEPAFGFLRRIYPHETIRKLVEVLAECLPNSNATSTRTHEDARLNQNLHDINLQVFEDRYVYAATVIENSRDEPNLETSFCRPPQMVMATVSDDGSISSDGSDDRNEYNILAAVQGLDRPVDLLASVDTQCPCEFIFQDALAKIGDVKTIDIPESRRKAYKSPLFPGGEITPKKYIVLRVWLYQINVHLKVELKVLDVSDPNGFEILLGRKINKKYRENYGVSLIGLLDRANIDGPRTGSLISPIRVARRSKEQKAIDEAKKAAVREQQQREHNELYRKRGTAPTPLSPAAKTKRTESTSNASDIDGPWSSHSAGYPTTRPYFKEPATQQLMKEITTTQVPEYALSQRADSISTQNTNFSFGRQSTTSSMSSVWDMATSVHKTVESAPKHGAQRKGIHHDGSN